MTQIKVAHGNTKLPKSTMIINMGTSKYCPSRLKGLCKIADKCYAQKPEKRFPATCVQARQNQAKYWLSNSAEKIANDLIGEMRRYTNKIRINESGDFYSQKCVEKLDQIAKIIKERKGIEVYGYTARSDLNFSGKAFTVKGSGHDNGNNGRCDVFAKGAIIPDNYTTCSGSCKTCDICTKQDSTINIAFIQH